MALQELPKHPHCTTDARMSGTVAPEVPLLIPPRHWRAPGKLNDSRGNGASPVYVVLQRHAAKGHFANGRGADMRETKRGGRHPQSKGSAQSCHSWGG